MLVTRIISVGILILLISNIEGLTNISSKIASSSGNQTDKNQVPCCILGNHHFNSIVQVLSNVTSNAIVTLVSDAVLSSIMILQNLENITITGQGNPTVNCNGVGGIKFDSCSHVTIKGVSFKRCGRRSAYPGIEFYHSSNVIFDSCSFCYSIRRAVVLSKVSGKVYINNCQFVHMQQILQQAWSSYLLYI